LSYIFRNDVQIPLVRVDLSAWFSLSVVPFSYVVGVVVPSLFCSVIGISWIFRRFQYPFLVLTWNINFVPFELDALCGKAWCSCPVSGFYYDVSGRFSRTNCRKLGVLLVLIT